MPQSLSDEWQSELGENATDVHEKYLHTIGNLTLTGYNQELSNCVFKDKQKIPGGFRDSPLYLNRSLAQAERWNGDAILIRATEFSVKALNIWCHHGAPRPAEQAKEEGWTLAEHRYLTGEIMKLFQQLRGCILKLDASISEQINKYEIVYKANTKFAEIKPQSKQLLLWLKIPIDEIDDPLERCESRTNYPEWVVFGVSPAAELDYIVTLVCQAYEKQNVERL